MRTARFFLGCLAGWGAVATATAQPSVIVKLAPQKAGGFAIPADFCGLSFEISQLLPDKDGQRFFRADNAPLLALFRAAGIKNIRIGGGTAEDRTNRIPPPAFADIDSLFAFARAADVRVIYTLRLLNGDQARNARVAHYIWERYRAQLSYFQIGNEPDWKSYHVRAGYVPKAGIFQDPEIFETVPGVPGTAYPSYLKKWRRFAAALAAAAPGAQIGGPDTGSDFPVSKATSTDFEGRSWTEHLADDAKASGLVREIDLHDYIGQGAAGVSVETAVTAMLSPQWDTVEYPALFRHVMAPVIADGLRYRMTECNDYTGGVDGASNAFASALWALDYMHWQAEHGASGVNFHNKRWIFTDTVLPDAAGRLHLNPKGYAIKAFNLGSGIGMGAATAAYLDKTNPNGDGIKASNLDKVNSQGDAMKAFSEADEGRTEGVTVENRDQVNLTVYAVRGPQGHWVTLINKEHGTGGRSARVVIAEWGKARSAQIVLLTAPNGDPTARSGITLGGAALDAEVQWAPLTADASGDWTVDVPATAAAVLRIE